MQPDAVLCLPQKKAREPHAEDQLSPGPLGLTEEDKLVQLESQVGHALTGHSQDLTADSLPVQSGLEMLRMPLLLSPTGMRA